MATIHPVLSSKPYHLIRTELREILQWGDGVDLPDSILLTERGWTLHEFDFKLNHVVFLDVGADTELFTAAFSYQRQVTTAKRVAFLSFENFLDLAQKLKQPKPFVHLFNIGHCGSTLLHQVINESGAAWGLSEPKFTLDLSYNRAALSDEKRVTMADAALRFLSMLPKVNERKTLALKHFSQGMKILETWNQASSDATNLFLYRDAYSHANSRFGFGQRKGRPMELVLADRHARWTGFSSNTPISALDGILDLNSEDVRYEDLTAVTWAMMIQDYQKAKASGMRIEAFNYAQLLKERSATVAKIFALCGIPTNNVEKALAAFDRDSHEGEVTSRDKAVEKLPAEAKMRTDIILNHPRFKLDPFVLL